MANRSWWSDWGVTSEIENCIAPFPPLPPVPTPPIVPTDGGGLQPRISDFMIFPSSVVETYFIVYGGT